MKRTVCMARRCNLLSASGGFNSISSGIWLKEGNRHWNLGIVGTVFIGYLMGKENIMLCLYY